jgi:hypothetical protein
MTTFQCALHVKFASERQVSLCTRSSILVRTDDRDAHLATQMRSLKYPRQEWRTEASVEAIFTNSSSADRSPANEKESFIRQIKSYEPYDWRKLDVEQLKRILGQW